MFCRTFGTPDQIAEVKVRSNKNIEYIEKYRWWKKGFDLFHCCSSVGRGYDGACKKCLLGRSYCITESSLFLMKWPLVSFTLIYKLCTPYGTFCFVFLNFHSNDLQTDFKSSTVKLLLSLTSWYRAILNINNYLKITDG